MTLHIEMDPKEAQKRIAIIARIQRDIYLAFRQKALAEQRSMTSVISLLLQRWITGEIDARPPRSQTRKEPEDADDDSS